MPSPGEVIKSLLDRPIAFHPALARAVGSVNAGVLLSQMVYWSKRTDDADGWFWKELGEWQDETCLTERELRSARRQVEASGVVSSRYDRSRHRLSWRVDLDRLVGLLGGGEHLTKRQVPSDETSGATCQNVNSIYGTETTAEITAETTRGVALGSPPSQTTPARARCSCSRGPDDDPPPPPPKGGRPAPKPPVAQSAPCRPEVVHSQPAHPEPVSAVLDEILRPHPELVQAAWPAAVPLGLVAQAVLERRDQVEVLAVLLCARAKRSRLRSPAAFFRAKVLCRPLGAPAIEPRLCDWTDAKRLLVGDVGTDPRARAFASRCGAVVRNLDGRRPVDAWREAAAARAALKRAQDLEQLRQNLHRLHGERRRWAEQLLAGESSPQRAQRAQSARRIA